MNLLRPLSLASIAVIVSASGIAFADTPTPAPDSTAPVVRVGSATITEGQLEQKFAPQLYDAEKNLYMTKESLATQMARDMLFDQAAKAAGMSREAWEKKEIGDKVGSPTEQEIDDIIQRMGGAQAKSNPAQAAAMRPQAAAYLQQQKRAQLESDLYKDLSAKTTVQMLLVKPVAPRVDVPFNAKLNPSKGPKNAPVTIVEFTDFECPWCKRSQPTLQQVEATYGDKLRLIAHNFPLPMHPRAEPAAEAAMCAKEQNKYWEYRDKLFDKQELSDADFKRYAQELKLNEKKFDKCLAEHKYANAVKEDQALGEKLGVNGTPTFFVNGVKIGYTEIDGTVKDELNNQHKG